MHELSNGRIIPIGPVHIEDMGAVPRLLYPQLQKDYLALLFHGRKE